MLRILNLNIWNYNHFNERKLNIIQFIKKYNPDIVTLQEVRDDLRFNKKGDNQAKQLNKILKYKYNSFMETMDVNKVNKTFSNPRCFEGIALLSKFPIVKIIKKKLKKHPKDEYTRGLLYIQIKYNKIINIFVVHYSPNDLFSKLHLKETLKFAKDNKIKPIIVGDFNMRKTKILNNLTKKDYISSIDIKKYISYPSAKYTLDYIVIPKIYKFKSFKSVGTKISDHKALVADITL